MVESLTPQLAEYFGVKRGEGVLIRGVERGSAAARAGLRAGDVIVSVDKEQVSDVSDWRRVMRSKSGNVALGIIREKKQQTVPLKVPDRKTREQGALTAPDFEFNFSDMDVDMDEMRMQLDELKPQIREQTRMMAMELEKQRPQIEKAIRDVRKNMKEVEIDREKIRKEAEKARAELSKLDVEKIRREALTGIDKIDLEKMQKELKQQMEELQKNLREQRDYHFEMISY
jgi:membrane-associated protease RseP (regulator of RpoE activity)